MTLRPERCDPHGLDLFLLNRLPEEFQGRLEAHLLACPACRDKLDELAGGPRWWTEVRRHLAGDLPRRGAGWLAGEAADTLEFNSPSSAAP